MSANLENLVLIVQPIDLQQLIWQRLLESQDIAATFANPESDILFLLEQNRKTAQPLPKILLIDQQLPNWNWETFCQSCQQEYPELEIILLSRSSGKIPPLQRHAALQAGAKEVLPAFAVDTLALDAIMSLKPVLATLDQTKQNDALAASIVTLKREIESLSEENISSDASLKVEYQDYSDFLDSSTKDENVSEPETKKRTYRGRSY